jgi:cytochrome c-type biogenesis protein CcmH/NrfG
MTDSQAILSKREHGVANQPTEASIATSSLKTAQVWGMAVVSLAIGLALGYLLKGSLLPESPAQSAVNGVVPAAQPTPNAASVSSPAGAMSAGHMPSLAEMKQMADKQAAPLLEKLKTNPNDATVLVQVGAIYHTTHQFKEAAVYYGRAVQVDPKNVAIRTKLASSLYRNGDVDGAIAQLNKALTYDPKDANALFDLGVIKLQGKQDGRGALAAWQRLLKTNPQLSPDRKATVLKLMADVLTTMGDQPRTHSKRSTVQ